MQSNLADLNYYKSSIDGLYGKRTAVALKDYNSKYLNASDLNKAANAKTLINAVIKNPLPKKPAIKKPVIEIKLVEGPSESQEQKIEKARALQKELGLSFYGSFVHSAKAPNALFFFDRIENNDSFEFRKALRNHQID